MAVNMEKISLQDIISLCTSLGSLVNSLSDHRSLVMVIGNGGEVTFNKQALHIVLESCQGHPLQKLIASAAHQYHIETGNDCKIFMLLLKEIMNGVKELLTKLDEIQVRRLLLKETSCLMHHLPEIFKEIKASNALISDPFSDTSPFSKNLKYILLTFLESKFSLCIAKVLSELMGEFILKSISDWSHALDHLNYLECHFSVFCSKYVSPVSQSCVLKGFVLNCRLDIKKPSNDELVRFVIVWNLPRKMDDAVWVMKKETLQSSYYWESFVKSLCSLKSHGISAIISSDIACENIKSLCVQNKMLLISGVQKEDIENIIFFNGISPLTFINNSLDPQNIGCLKSIQTIQGFTHLETLSDIGVFRPHHILLSAQLNSVWKEYYSECQNCLKVVKHWLNPEMFHFPVEEQQSLMFPGDSSTDRKGDSRPHVFGIALPLGSFEIFLRKTLNKSKETQTLFPRLLFILNSALLRVACGIWGIPLRCFNREQTFTQFIEKKKLSLIHPIEPLQIREIQLCKVLQLVQQLIRIDSILPTKF